MTPTEQKTKLKLILKLLTELQGDFKLTKATENVKHTIQILEFNNKPIGLKSPSIKTVKDYRQPVKPKRKDLWGI